MKTSSAIASIFGKKLSELETDELFQKLSEGARLKKIDNYHYLNGKKKKVELVFDEEKNLIAIHLHSDKHFSLEFLFGDSFANLNFMCPKAQVNKLLGTPSLNGAGIEIPILGKSTPWDKYLFEDFSIRFEYSDDNNKIIMISILSPNWKNGHR